MKALVTGSGGFVAAWLKKELTSHGYDVCGTDIAPRGEDLPADLTDADDAKDLVAGTRPDAVFHLAGLSSAALCWKQPQLAVDVNIKGTVNLLEAVRAYGRARVLIAGSSEVYGRVTQESCPIKETQRLAPANPYAVTKQACEQLGILYSQAYGMDTIMTRSFNHTGPGQKQGFVIPDFCFQIARAELGGPAEMGVGNLAARRDFSDVRDVVRAYRLLMEKGGRGEVYNVGSGNAYSMRDLLDQLVEMADRPIKVYEDPEKFRPVDLPVIQGDIQKLQTQTGYKPAIDIKTTLRDTLFYWRGTIKEAK